MTTKKLKLAYVDHEFKRRTRSSDFLKELLAAHFELTELWESDWNCRPCRSLPELRRGRYEIIIFFQVIPGLKELRQLACDRLFWVPMADQEIPAGLYSKLCHLQSRIRIICFCRKLYDYYTDRGFCCLYLQYFRAPLPRVATTDNRVFAWLRTAAVDWHVIKQLLPEGTRVVLRHHPDPGEVIRLPSQEDYRKFDLQVLDGWLERQEYEKLIDSCNIFIAPRRLEGIGQSFLEAMARGMCVIASDTPTMNEYIRHGHTGLLFDLKRPVKLDLSNASRLGKNMHAYNKQKYEEWQRGIPRLLGFIEDPTRVEVGRWRLWRNTCEYLIMSPLGFVRKAVMAIIRKITGYSC